MTRTAAGDGDVAFSFPSHWHGHGKHERDHSYWPFKQIASFRMSHNAYSHDNNDIKCVFIDITDGNLARDNKDSSSHENTLKGVVLCLTLSV